MNSAYEFAAKVIAGRTAASLTTADISKLTMALVMRFGRGGPRGQVALAHSILINGPTGESPHLEQLRVVMLRVVRALCQLQVDSLSRVLLEEYSIGQDAFSDDEWDVRRALDLNVGEEPS